MVVFSANPLSLTLPDAAFESWLRDKGYLEILDERTTTSTNPIPTSSSSFSSSPPSSSSPSDRCSSHGGSFVLAIIKSLVSVMSIVVSLITINPFAKLTADDFTGETPSWTVGFVGLENSYSWPSGPSQARMRVHENVKRYARSYSVLSLVFFACSLYQMPVALVGLIMSLALWEAFKFCSNRWVLERHPFVHQAFLRLFQFATAVILYSCNVQIALFCAIGISYAVMILHASLRKLTPSKLPDKSHKRFHKNKHRI